MTPVVDGRMIVERRVASMRALKSKTLIRARFDLHIWPSSRRFRAAVQ
jgi:hypothetical protein